MAANLVYCLPSDNFVDGLGVTDVVSDSGVVDSDFPVTNLYDGTPATQCRFTGTGGSVVFDLGAAQQVDLVALIAHSLDGTVTIQGNATNAWGAPSVAVTVPTVTQDADGYWPNRWVDLSVSVPTAGDRTLRYWRVLVSGNTAPWGIGEVWLATRRQLAENYSWGYRESNVAQTMVHRTDAGVTFAYGFGTRMRQLDAELEATDAVISAMQTLWIAARGRARAFLIVPLGNEGEVWQVRFADDDLPTTRVFQNHSVLPVRFEEVSRGLA